MSWLKPLRDLWTAAYNLTHEERARSVQIAAWLGAALVAAGIALTERVAEHTVGADSPWWDSVLIARLGLTRLAMAIPLLVLAVFLALLCYQVIENSNLGRRLLIWHANDGVQTKAQKTRNAGALLATLLLTFVVGLLLGVLR